MIKRQKQPFIFNSFLIGSLVLISSLLFSPDYGVAELAGRCVETPGMPCADISSGRSGSGKEWTRPDVDPAIEKAQRLERTRQKKLRKRNRTPYKGIRSRVKDTKEILSQILYRVGGETSPIVKSVTYEEVPGEWGNIFVPDPTLGNIKLARPVNPTIRETKAAAEQLAKVWALYAFMKNNVSSAEDTAFLANQAASILVGGRSYVHITLSGSWRAPVWNDTFSLEANVFEKGATNVDRLLGEMSNAQQRIRQSEKVRTQILNKAKKDIKQLATLNERIKSEKSEKKKNKMAKRASELSSNIDNYENEYFKLWEKEDEDAKAIDRAAKQLKRTVE